MELQGLELLPVIFASWTLLGFTISYVLTILNGHADSYLLYISETGDYFPESVVFTVVFFFSAVLDAILSYCMYRFDTIKSSEIQHGHNGVQYAILLLGWIASVGIAIVAIFPAVHHPLPHRIAAAVALIGDAIRNTCQAKLLYKLSFDSRHMCHLRMSISIITILSLIILMFSRLTEWQFCSGRVCLQITEHINIITEWIGAIGIIVCNLTLCADFQHLVFKWQNSFKVNCFILREKLDTQSDHKTASWARRTTRLIIVPFRLQPLLCTKLGIYWNEEQDKKLVHRNIFSTGLHEALLPSTAPSLCIAGPVERKMAASDHVLLREEERSCCSL